MNINWNDPNFQGFGRQPRPKRSASPWERRWAARC